MNNTNYFYIVAGKALFRRDRMIEQNIDDKLLNNTMLTEEVSISLKRFCDYLSIFLKTQIRREEYFFHVEKLCRFFKKNSLYIYRSMLSRLQNKILKPAEHAYLEQLINYIDSWIELVKKKDKMKVIEEIIFILKNKNIEILNNYIKYELSNYPLVIEYRGGNTYIICNKSLESIAIIYDSYAFENYDEYRKSFCQKTVFFLCEIEIKDSFKSINNVRRVCFYNDDNKTVFMRENIPSYQEFYQNISYFCFTVRNIFNERELVVSLQEMASNIPDYWGFMSLDPDARSLILKGFDDFLYQLYLLYKKVRSQSQDPLPAKILGVWIYRLQLFMGILKNSRTMLDNIIYSLTIIKKTLEIIRLLVLVKRIV